MNNNTSIDIVAKLLNDKLSASNDSARALAAQYNIPYEYLVKIKNGNVTLSYKSKYVANFAKMLNIPQSELEKALQADYLKKYSETEFGKTPEDVLSNTKNSPPYYELCRSLIKTGLLSEKTMPYVSINQTPHTTHNAFCTDNPADSLLPVTVANKIVCTTEQCIPGQPCLTVLNNNFRVRIYQEPMPDYENIFMVRGFFLD